MNDEEARALGKRLLEEGGAAAAQAAALEVSPEERSRAPSRGLAAVMSLLVPGWGLAYAGRPRLGWAVLAAVLAPLLLLPWTPWGLWAFVALWWLMSPIVSAIARHGVREEPFGVLLEFGLRCGALVGFSLVLHTWVAGLYKIPSTSMTPTLEVGDHVVVRKWDRSPARGDVIVFAHPRAPDKDFIQRVVAVAGDRITVKNGVITLNGTPVPHEPTGAPCAWKERMGDYGPHARWRERTCASYREQLGGRRYTVIRDPDALTRDFPGFDDEVDEDGAYVVPAGHVFVLGDNRDSSHDSRFWGPVPLANVRGTARYLWWAKDGETGATRWVRIGHEID